MSVERVDQALRVLDGGHLRILVALEPPHVRDWPTPRTAGDLAEIMATTLGSLARRLATLKAARMVYTTTVSGSRAWVISPDGRLALRLARAAQRDPESSGATIALRRHLASIAALPDRPLEQDRAA